MSSACEVCVDEIEPEEARRQHILLAAIDCFTRLGIERTSILDVAKSANVARGTIYRYFEHRRDLVTAALDFGATEFYRELTAAMAEHATLTKQMGAMAEAFARILTDHRTRSRLMTGDTELIHHMISDGGTAVDRITAFLIPYVSDARSRGELRHDIDCSAAGEWLARVIFSLATVGPARSFDLAHPETVRKHMEEFGISGLR